MNNDIDERDFRHIVSLHRYAVREAGYRRINIAQMLLLPHDILEEKWLECFEHAIGSTTNFLDIPSDVLDLLDTDYSDPNQVIPNDQVRVAVDKLRAYATVLYLEDTLKCATPLVEDFYTRIIGNSKRYAFSIDYADFPDDCSKVLVVFGGLNIRNQAIVVYEGVVQHRANGVIVVISHAEDVPEGYDIYENVTVFQKPCVREFEARLYGIAGLQNDANIRSILFGPFDDQNARTHYNNIMIPDSTRVNFQQRRAITEMIHQTSNHPFILFGPPGTGKTTTLSKFIETLIGRPRNHREEYNRDVRILVVAETNFAANVLVEKLLQNGVIGNYNIFRLMSLRRIPTETPNIVNVVTLTDDVTGMYIIPEKLKDFLRTKFVIVSTIGMSSHLYSLGKGYFSHIVFEEAGQISESSVLIPLANHCNSMTRVIFSGDPKQLPAPLLSSSLNAIGSKVVTPSITRLVKLNIFSQSQHFMVTLIDNYRSSANLMSLYSIVSYQNRLVACHNDYNMSLANSTILDRQRIPVRWHVIDNGLEMVDPVSKSLFNYQEIEAVVDYVVKAIRENIAPDDIGIITPYRAQVCKIRDALERRFVTGVEVDTVESFQGREKRVIIISLVRTEGIGFLADYRRFNTAVTRAKHMLIIVGDPTTFLFALDEDYYHYLHLLHERNLFWSNGQAIPLMDHWFDM